MTRIGQKATKLPQEKTELVELKIYTENAIKTSMTAKETDSLTRFYRCAQEKEGGNYGALAVIIIILVGCIAHSRYNNKKK